MKARQWSRLYRSTYGKPRPWTYNFLLFYVIVYVIYLVLQIQYFDKGVSSFSFGCLPNVRWHLAIPWNIYSLESYP